MNSRDEHGKRKDGKVISSNGTGEGLGPNSEIGRKLKQYYDDLVSDDVPDKFMELLSRLDNGADDGKSKAKD